MQRHYKAGIQYQTDNVDKLCNALPKYVMAYRGFILGSGAGSSTNGIRRIIGNDGRSRIRVGPRMAGEK